MQLLTYATLLLFFLVQETVIASSTDESCTFSRTKYTYASHAAFQYVPTAIIDQTVLNITADVIYYRSKSPCQQSFVKLQNVTVAPSQGANIQTDTEQLEDAIPAIFRNAATLLESTSEKAIVSENDQNRTDQYHQSKTVHTNHGQFRGNSLFANYLLNKLFSPTITACDTIVNSSTRQLQSSACRSTTAGLLTVDRQIRFHSQLDDQLLPVRGQNRSSRSSPTKTVQDFDRLLKEFCANGTFHSDAPLLRMMKYELTDDDLQQILSKNISQYSPCEWKLIHRSVIEVHRHPATDYVLNNFHHDTTAIARHLEVIESQPSDRIRESIRKYLNDSGPTLNFLTLRMLLLASNDNLTIQCALKRDSPLIYRAIALRTLHQPNHFVVQFRSLLVDEREPAEIRIVAFQAIRSFLNASEMQDLVDTVRSDQVRFYIKSLFQQSSIWSAHSGTYTFPFGNVSTVFHDNPSSFLPTIIQLELANHTEIDLHVGQEILLIFGRRSIIRFSTFDDLFNWLNDDRLFEIETLDGCRLRINLTTDLNLDWLLGYFDQWKNFFRKSSTSIALKIQHGLDHTVTGYELQFRIEADFQIHLHRHANSTSYIWRAMQKENTLFKIQQSFHPLAGNQPILAKSPSTSSPTTKDFCYIIPHFDSKICLSILFKRLWPSSIAIRLLADDPALVYNLTVSQHHIHFHIQQHQHIYRSYRLTHMYDEHSQLPYYIEFSTPTTNYTSLITWNQANTVSFNLQRNNQSIVHGSGDYQYNSSQGLSIHFTDIHPKHIGHVFIHYDGNLTINASKFLGGQFLTRVTRPLDWKQARIEMKVTRVFFFFKQDFTLDLHYNLRQSLFNMTAVRNEDSRLQWMFMKESSSFHHLFIINTSLIELDHLTQAQYKSLSHVDFRSSSLMNGWSLWNISFQSANYRQLHFHFNQYFLSSHVAHRSLELKMAYSRQTLFRSYFHINQSNFVTTVVEIPGHHYEGKGQLFVQYTNFSLSLPIIETFLDMSKKKSTLQVEFISLPNILLLKITADSHGQYLFHSLSNFTFLNNYPFQTSMQHSLMRTLAVHHQILSLHSFSQYLQNSTMLQSSNGSLQLPSSIVTKPLLFHYQKDSQLFVQIFEWANFTRTLRDYRISTASGLELVVVNDFPTRIHVQFEQHFLGKPYLLLFELDRNWMMSLLINKNIRYEFVSSPLNSSFTLQRIDLKTNQSQMLPINYRTDNQTLFRLEIAFSKFVSTFVNDFIVDISLKNHSLKFSCHIPVFKREFFSLTWNRSVQKEVFHFHGVIEMRLVRRRHWLDLTYDWNLASIRSWTFQTRLAVLSFDPIQWNFNITNDYLWYGKWAVDFRMMLGHRRELIRLHHQYHYTTTASSVIFDLHLINSHYHLDLNYHHSNHSIEGLFVKDRHRQPIDGYWNATANVLQLNTPTMKSTTTIASAFIRSIIDYQQEKIGVLYERTTGQFSSDSQIAQCNPYMTFQIHPRLFVLHYYTLNDGLSTMMLEWSTRSYLSWNYTGHGRTILPVRKFEVDLRTKYVLHVHTTTFKYASIYNSNKRQLTLRRVPIVEDADDRFELKIRYHYNHTWLLHLQVINNHYVIIGDPNLNETSWSLRGHFQNDPFHGSLSIPNDDWYLSSKLNFNSSLFLSTGRYVQLLQTPEPQIAFDIRFKSDFHLAWQYTGLRSLIAFKFFHNASDINLYFSSKALNQSTFAISFQLNDLINQSWTLTTTADRIHLSSDNSEFVFNGSLQDFSALHRLDGKSNLFSMSKDTIQYLSGKFGVIISNLSSDTTCVIHAYNLESKENFTINYYKSGKFSLENLNIQTPIYDLSVLYHPNTDEDRYVKVLFELLPLQMSSFSFVRGRSFRLGYQTPRKQLLLSGNLAFGLEDISNREKIVMNERWKLTYGYETSEKIYIRWKLNIDTKQKTMGGKVTIEDPNSEMSTPVYLDLNGHLVDTLFIVDLHAVYSSPTNDPRPVQLQLQIDQRFLTQQYIALKILHESSKTNLSFSLDRYPHRKLHLRFKPNNFSHDKTFLHLYANTTESQLHFLVHLANFIHFNLTLPKSYPETGVLHSALFIDNQEYFDGRFDTAVLKIRTKDYLFNLTTNQLFLQTRSPEQILASMHARWLDRNLSTALITIFSQTNFERRSVALWQVNEQKTWLRRFEQFLSKNRLAFGFMEDLQTFLTHLETDLIREHGDFGVQLANHLRVDDDFQLGLQRINSTVRGFVQAFGKIGLHVEKLLEEYMNNLTCLIHHRNLLHLDLSRLVTSIIDAGAFATVHQVNRSFVIFDHFARYPRSINAALAYLSNDVVVHIYQFINEFYLETKQFVLSKAIQYLYEIDFVWKVSPLLWNSITYFSSPDIRALLYFSTDRLRRLLSLWLNSPVDYKIMKTFTSALIALIDKLRFYVDDKLDFLLPTLQTASPRLLTNGTSKQTFLLTWLKHFNVTKTIDSE